METDNDADEGQAPPPQQIVALDLSYNHHLLVPLHGSGRRSPVAADPTQPPPPPLLTRLLTLPPIMRGLRRLELGHCRLGDAGLQQLLAAFPTLACLQHLGLATNRLTDRGCAALFAALTGRPDGGGSGSNSNGGEGGLALIGAAAVAAAPTTAAVAAAGNAATVSPTASNATSLPSPPSAGSDRRHYPYAAHPTNPVPLLPRLRALDLCDNGCGDHAASDLIQALSLRSARLQPSPPPLAVDLRLSPMGHEAGVALVRAAHALQQREGGMRVTVCTSRIKYWG
jgi:hypothetical protein